MLKEIGRALCSSGLAVVGGVPIALLLYGGTIKVLDSFYEDGVITKEQYEKLLPFCGAGCGITAGEVSVLIADKYIDSMFE